MTKKEAAKEFMNKIEDPSELKALYDKIIFSWKRPPLHESDRAVKKACALSHEKKEDVIIKISAINQIYSTYIRCIDTYPLALLITEQAPKEGLKNLISTGDSKAVHIIANSDYFNNKLSGINNYLDTKFVKMDNHYSFATKYCSFHNPGAYPIYDIYIKEFTKLFIKNNPDAPKLPNIEHYSSYENFRQCIDYIIEWFTNKGLCGLDYKKLDQFIWKGIDDIYKNQ